MDDNRKILVALVSSRRKSSPSILTYFIIK